LDARTRLFTCKDIYNFDDTAPQFIEAVKANILHHQRHCAFYAKLLAQSMFKPEKLQTADECAAIPVIPAAFFKRHEILSIPHSDISIHATSSGTQGQKSQVFIDDDSLSLGTRMVINCFRYHKLISRLPTNYIMLGYEPSDENTMGAIKTAMGITRLAPAASRTFVLRKAPDGYTPDWCGVLTALRRLARQHLPVRFVGFPAFLYKLLIILRKEGLSYKFGKRSCILLGGGWKQFAGETINKHELYAIAEETLGIPAARFRDFYSAVEHSIAYAECENHHMHVPIWSRVFIRDIKTLEPVGFDTPGFLSFVTPLILSQPLVSVMMNDIAVLHDGKDCGCGIKTPYFEVLGRAGTGSTRNCALSADELLR
jgi:phenylacetate-coenzyme A ligase PaaK-like adenylate-forming protein